METQTKYKPIDFAKIDKKRPQSVNSKILELFDQFINSKGISEILAFYKSQCSLLYIGTIADGTLHFYGCEKNIEHHSSNIEYIVKFVLHRMLHENGGRKTLTDRHSLALVGFGFLPLFRSEESGNGYQGFKTEQYCNIKTFEVSLSNQQIESAKQILRLINNRFT